MLDPKLIRKDPDAVRAGLEAKKHDPAAVDRWLALDGRRREALHQVEMLKADRNTQSLEIGRIKKSGGDASDAQQGVRALGDSIKELDDTIRELDDEIASIADWFPNLPHASTPVGGEPENQELRTWGDPVTHDFDAQTHEVLGKNLGLMNFDHAVAMSGQGFAALRGPGARLNRALIQFMLDLHTQHHGFTEMSVPYLVKRHALYGTGQLPKLEEDMYRTDPDDMFLIPTAEVSVTNLHSGDTLLESDLPIKYVAHSPCFRREAGSYGVETKGLTRVHQFDKVEMVKFVHPQESYDELDALLQYAETVLQKLNLSYRVLLLASGDISFAAAKCYDLEVWAPGAGRWLEVSSCSNFEDFQARRCNIRYKPNEGGRPEFVHTLNASGLALPRTIISVLETYQNADGAVTVPEVLRPYMGGQEVLS